MTSRLDNLQTVFDRTDWREFAKQKAALEAVVEQYDEAKIREGLHQLLNWLHVIKGAARMDGYQTEKEPAHGSRS